MARKIVKQFRQLVWLGSFRFLRVLVATRSVKKRKAVSSIPQVLNSVAETEAEEVMVRERKVIRERALRWYHMQQAWKESILFGYAATAECLEITFDPKMKEDAENYFAANPQQILRVGSLEELEEQDKGGNYMVVYPPTLSAEEMAKIQSQCRALRLNH